MMTAWSAAAWEMTCAKLVSAKKSGADQCGWMASSAVWGMTLPSRSRLYALWTSAPLIVSKELKCMHHVIVLDPIAPKITSQEMAQPTAWTAMNFANKSSMPLTLQIKNTMHVLASTGTVTANSFTTFNPLELLMMQCEAGNASDRSIAK